LTTRPDGTHTLTAKWRLPLMEKAKAGDLFAKTPEIQLGILADKLPK
jgi:hypothetical protein